MSRASQFIELINIGNLRKKKTNYFRNNLTDLEITDNLKEARKKYRHNIKQHEHKTGNL